LSRQVALAHGANQPFWITEIGWSTANTPDSVTEAAQAANIRDAVARAERDWGSFVAHIFVYTWDRSGSNTGDREANYGLRRADGTSKPAWDTLKALVSRLARRSVLTRR
jgi:exo-beta-1,3-glucanase (GH17 family)